MKSTEVCPFCVSNPLEESNTVSSLSWIQCEPCAQWFHVKCLHIPNVEINNLHSYHCQDCSGKMGPSVYKRRSKRAKISIDYVSLNDGQSFVTKSAHPHVSQFIHLETPEPSSLLVTSSLDKSMLNKIPILVPSADLNLVGMRLCRPPNEIDLDFITSKVGEDTPIEVMDVLSQQSVQPAWNMGKWRDYFKTDSRSRDRIRNVISLEISDVEELGVGFTRPKLVRELDLVDKVWDPLDEQSRSKVTKYCLMSVADAFTDFHIDFGGTSVYYTVCSGLKSFLMYPPTTTNLSLYKDWCLEQDQNSIWFPEYSKNRLVPTGGMKVTLKPRDLFIIPSGWIHAVHTPEDSIVIGGNFLTLQDMQKQLQINALERETRVPSRFRFPMFNKVLWLASYYYVNHKQEFDETLKGIKENLPDEKKVHRAEQGPPKSDNAKKDLIYDRVSKSELPTKTLTDDNPEYMDSQMVQVQPESALKMEETQNTRNYKPNTDPIEEASLSKQIISCLKNHLSEHYQTSKTNSTAKRSLPINLIGKDVSAYLEKLQKWHDTY